MIYLLRHGQTVFNRAGRFQGQADSPLTGLGRSQAAEMATELFRLIGGDAVKMVASPLGRAVETARIIAEFLPGASAIALEPRLMEIGMGCWDGLTSAEIDRQWPGRRAGLGRGEWFFHSPDGERYPAFAARIAAALADVAADPARAVVIVSHGIAGRVARALHAGLDQATALRLEVPQDAFFALLPGGGLRRYAT